MQIHAKYRFGSKLIFLMAEWDFPAFPLHEMLLLWHRGALRNHMKDVCNGKWGSVEISI